MHQAEAHFTSQKGFWTARHTLEEPPKCQADCNLTAQHRLPCYPRLIEAIIGLHHSLPWATVLHCLCSLAGLLLGFLGPLDSPAYALACLSGWTL